MKCCSALSLGAISLTAILGWVSAAGAQVNSYPVPAFNPELVVPTPILRRRACAADYSVPFRRGIAILSPLESPDRCDYPVRGKTIFTAYYPDYCAHRKGGPRVFIPGNGRGYHSRCAIGPSQVYAEIVDAEGQVITESGYGGYQGARQDEANLLRLGGMSGECGEMPESDDVSGAVEMLETTP